MTSIRIPFGLRIAALVAGDDLKSLIEAEDRAIEGNWIEFIEPRRSLWPPTTWWAVFIGPTRDGSLVLRQWSRGQIETRLPNMRPCLPAKVCEKMKRDGGFVFAAHANTGDPFGQFEACQLMKTQAR